MRQSRPDARKSSTLFMCVGRSGMLKVASSSKNKHILFVFCMSKYIHVRINEIQSGCFHMGLVAHPESTVALDHQARTQFVQMLVP